MGEGYLYLLFYVGSRLGEYFVNVFLLAEFEFVNTGESMDNVTMGFVYPKSWSDQFSCLEIMLNDSKLDYRVMDGEQINVSDRIIANLILPSSYVAVFSFDFPNNTRMKLVVRGYIFRKFSQGLIFEYIVGTAREWIWNNGEAIYACINKYDDVEIEFFPSEGRSWEWGEFMWCRWELDTLGEGYTSVGVLIKKNASIFLRLIIKYVLIILIAIVLADVFRRNKRLGAKNRGK